MSAPPGPSARIPPLVLVLAVPLVFGASRSFGFVAWDDDLHLAHNPHLNPLSAQGLLALWTAPYERLYTPLPYTFWAGLALLAESLGAGGAGVADHARLFHRANLVLHAGNALLVFGVLRALLRERRPRGATGSAARERERAESLACAAGAGVFAVHPLQVEAVAWVSGARDLLYAFLCLAALRAHLTDRRAGHAAATLAFVLALTAKPNAAALPALVLVLDVGVRGRSVWPTLRRLLPWLAAALLFALVSARVQPLEASPAPLWMRPLVAADTLAFYLGKLVWPAALGVDYGRSLFSLSVRPGQLARGALPVGLALALFLGRRRWSAPGWGFAVFAAGLLPVLGLVPYRFQLLSTVADRYVYLALLGPALALSLALASTRRRAPLVLGAGVLLALGALAARQTASWESSRALYAQALRANPRSVIGHAGLADLFLADGNHGAAIRHYRRALAVVPRIPAAQNRLGYALLQEGRSDEAIAVLERALVDRPDWVDLHGNLGEAWLAKGDLAKARAHFERAHALEPQHPLVRERLEALRRGGGEGAPE